MQTVGPIWTKRCMQILLDKKKTKDNVQSQTSLEDINDVRTSELHILSISVKDSIQLFSLGPFRASCYSMKLGKQLSITSHTKLFSRLHHFVSRHWTKLNQRPGPQIPDGYKQIQIQIQKLTHKRTILHFPSPSTTCQLLQTFLCKIIKLLNFSHHHL